MAQLESATLHFEAAGTRTQKVLAGCSDARALPRAEPPTVARAAMRVLKSCAGVAELGTAKEGFRTCLSAAAVAASIIFGVSISSSLSARARCFLASTRFPTRR